MEMRHLRYFVTIVESGSLSKAADQLYIAQPALSLNVRALEAELKTKLLFRSPQGVRPTEAGRRLYHHALTMLSFIEKINQEVRHGISSETGRVAIGLPFTLAPVLGSLLFQRVRTKYPGVHLHILEFMSELLPELLTRGRLDMAIVPRDKPTGGVLVQPLFDEDFYVFGRAGVPHKSTAGTCPVRQLSGVPMVFSSDFHEMRLMIKQAFAHAGAELNIVADVDSFATRMAIARKGLACTIVTTSNTLSPAKDEIDLRFCRRLVDPSTHRTVSICWSNSFPPTPATIAVYRLLLELVRELAHENPEAMQLRSIDETAYENSGIPL